MLKLNTLSYSLSLEYPFTISRYTVTTQQIVIVSISNGTHTGYGEATANPYYGSSVEKITASVESVKALVENSEELLPGQFWNKLEPHLKEDYFALCALDCAFWDLYARINDRPLRTFFCSSEEQSPLSNYTIGIDEVEVMQSKIIENPWPIYKIKLGTEDDLAIVRALRSVTDSVFRIDANCAWSVDQTLEYAPELKNLDVEFIEQPLPADKWDDMRYLKDRCELPLIADESCKRFDDIKLCANSFDGINIKLMKCGGLSPALRMIDTARNYGLKVMAGCMTESTIGISNLVQIAPLLDSIDADGALLLKKDIASGVKLVDGRIKFSEKPGSGTSLF
ncbi:MAG: dipeptide epimerase [Bacteroidia bacterium]|nr:dipeptide epimerase [Bacteroidia bacterium]NNF83443.1 dipeptide epimerase [Flavobacteriaceae bacterium]NNL81538.1 dipeptide epimerase [Flavobacteriaceae bacterium]